MNPLECAILDRIESIGEAKGIISDHWNEEHFEKGNFHDLSKHNEWFHSLYEEESEKLDCCRWRMRYYEDLLEKIYSVLTTE